jgi:hypothetical protein
MSAERKQVRVGDLLAQAGIIPSEYITTALQTFEERGLPIGKALVLSGHLTDQQLRTALEVQSLVNDGLMPVEIAVDVLAIAHRENLPLAEAFKRSGFVQPEDVQTNKLGQLLVDAGVVNKKQLEESLHTNIRTGLPLGHIFCFRGFVSQALVSTALVAQQFIRRGVIDRNSAIKALKAAFQREHKLEQVPINRGYQRLAMKPSLKIGELLTQARIITEQQLLDALHRSLLKGKFIGEILIELGFVDKNVVQASIELQEMLDNGTFRGGWAAEAILLVRTKNAPLPKVVAELGAFKSRQNKAVPLIELLTLAGVLQVTKVPGDVQGMLKDSFNQASEVSAILLENNLVSADLLICALRCVFLMEEKLLNLHQAIMAMDFAVRKSMTIDQAIYELGWTVRTRLREF